jgi:signal transduction histidine kinase
VFVPSPVALPPVITKVLDLIGGEAERRGIRVERDLADVPEVAGDEERIRQVLVNLALNAIEAAPAGGFVRVACRTEDPDAAPEGEAGWVTVTIDDSGPGVATDLRDRIFEPFFTTKAEGSGLGLSIVHAIVSQHGGTVAAEGAPDGGARFVLRLPRAR